MPAKYCNVYHSTRSFRYAYMPEGQSVLAKPNGGSKYTLKGVNVFCPRLVQYVMFFVGTKLPSMVTDWRKSLKLSTNCRVK